MKQFRFSLEHAMQWRRVRADMERAKLESLHAGLRRLVEQKSLLEREEFSAHDQVKNQGSTGASQLGALDRFSRHMLARKEELEVRRAEALAHIAQQQVRLVSARRDFELLDKLRTRKKEEWVTEFDREQEELAGELYLAKWERLCS